MDLAHRVKCSKNIVKAMAQKHQELMCYHLNSKRSLFTKQAMVGPVHIVFDHMWVYIQVCNACVRYGSDMSPS